MRAIDADALIAKCGEWYTEEGTEEGFIGTVKSLVDTMPTIEPERRGKWIKVDNGYSYWYECSECGCEPLRSKWNGQEVFSDFCPNCGARMEKGEQDG